jgi:hypothetical protein
MMVNQRHAAVRKTRSQVQVQPALLGRRNRTHHRNTIHLVGSHAGQIETHGDGFPKAVVPAAAARQLRFFHRGYQLAVHQNRTRSVA